PEGPVRRLQGACRRGRGPLADDRSRPPVTDSPRPRAGRGGARALGDGRARVSATAPVLAGTEDHPHARMVLGSALAAGEPSHAYLFFGPPGTGKRTAARALAAEILAGGEADGEAARRRVLAGTHRDLTWVRPTGAHVMR